MNKRFTWVFINTLKVGVAAWTAIWVEPWIAETLPNAGTPIHYLVAALLAALVLESAFQFFFGWPRIKIEWADKGESVPISEVVARIRPSNSESQAFTLKVSTPPEGIIGYQVLKCCMKRSNVRLQVRIEHALIVPTCEYPSKRRSTPTVTSDDRSNGFVIDLGPVPRRPGLWHHATVRWRDESTPLGERYNIDYVFDHDSRTIKFFLNRLIWRSKNAREFRVVGS